EPEGSLPRKVLDRFLQQQELASRLHIVTESTTLDILRRYVALGIGVTLTYLDDTIARSLSDLHVRVYDPAESLPVALVSRKGAHLSEPARDFAAVVRRHLARPSAIKHA